MAKIRCNFYSSSLSRAININLIIPSNPSSTKSCSHHHPDNYPVIYLLPPNGYDENAWLKYTSVARYAEESNIAVVMLPTENTSGMTETVYIPFGHESATIDSNDPFVDIRYNDFTNFITHELPDFVTSNFRISDIPDHQYLVGISDTAESAIYFSQCIKYQSVGLIDYTGSENFEEIGNATFYLYQHSQFLQRYSDRNIWAFADESISHFIHSIPRSDYYSSFPSRRM